MGLWWDPARVDERDRVKSMLDAEAARRPMARITPAELDKVLATYPQRMGLEADSLHPRLLLYLPAAYRARFLDILHAWEQQRSLPKGCAQMMVLAPKPEGGGFEPWGCRPRR